MIHPMIAVLVTLLVLLVGFLLIYNFFAFLERADRSAKAEKVNREQG